MHSQPFFKSFNALFRAELFTNHLTKEALDDEIEQFEKQRRRSKKKLVLKVTTTPSHQSSQYEGNKKAEKTLPSQNELSEIYRLPESGASIALQVLDEIQQQNKQTVTRFTFTPDGEVKNSNRVSAVPPPMRTVPSLPLGSLRLDSESAQQPLPNIKHQGQQQQEMPTTTILSSSMAKTQQSTYLTYRQREIDLYKLQRGKRHNSSNLTHSTDFLQKLQLSSNKIKIKLQNNSLKNFKSLSHALSPLSTQSTLLQSNIYWKNWKKNTLTSREHSPSELRQVLNSPFETSRIQIQQEKEKEIQRVTTKLNRLIESNALQEKKPVIDILLVQKQQEFDQNRYLRFEEKNEFKKTLSRIEEVDIRNTKNMTKEVPLGEVKESLKIFRQNYRQFESKYLEGMKYKKK